MLTVAGSHANLLSLWFVFLMRVGATVAVCLIVFVMMVV